MPTALIVLTALILPADGRALEDSTKKFDGAIHSAAQNQVVLKIGTELISFTVDDETVLTLDGKPAKPADLKTGDQAVIQAEHAEDESRRAVTIKVTRVASIDRDSRLTHSFEQ